MIAFNCKDKLPMLQNNNEFDLLYHVEENVWNNITSLQLNVKDIRASHPKK